MIENEITFHVKHIQKHCISDLLLIGQNILEEEVKEEPLIAWLYQGQFSETHNNRNKQLACY